MRKLTLRGLPNSKHTKSEKVWWLRLPSSRKRTTEETRKATTGSSSISTRLWGSWARGLSLKSTYARVRRMASSTRLRSWTKIGWSRQRFPRTSLPTKAFSRNSKSSRESTTATSSGLKKSSTTLSERNSAWLPNTTAKGVWRTWSLHSTLEDPCGR